MILWIKNLLSNIIYSLLMTLFSVFPIASRKVVFTNFIGKGYGDNPKYICEALLQDGFRGNLVWGVENMDTIFPPEVRKVKYGSLRWIYELCTAKVWIDNCRKPLYIKKRRGQYYIQTWHGDIALKKIEKDAEKVLSENYVKEAKNDSAMADLFISGNEWMTHKYRSAFWYNGNIAKCGYPRRDILYRKLDDLKSIKIDMGIPSDTMVLFYAPTFRKEQAAIGVSSFLIDWERLLTATSQKFGGEWIGIVRLHPNVAYMSSMLQLPQNVFDTTQYPDMQELLAISDICLSDYSSSVFEFGVTGKPAFIYASDIDAYKEDRGMYFQFEELPFPLAQDMDTLIDNIYMFDEGAYKSKSNHFYRDILGMYEEGQASKYISDIVRDVCLETLKEASTDVDFKRD